MDSTILKMASDDQLKTNVNFIFIEKESCFIEY